MKKLNLLLMVLLSASFCYAQNDRIIECPDSNNITSHNIDRLTAMNNNGSVNRLGQWYYYDNGVNESAVGTSGGQFWWGIMFPAGSYSGNAVTKVSAYDYMAMNGTVTVYNDGSNSPANAVGSMNVTFTGSGEFVEFNFSNPVMINPNNNVWIVFYNASGTTFPAAVCANTGNANGRWISTDGITWEDLASYNLDYTFMVRAFFEQYSSLSVDFEGGIPSDWTVFDANNDGYTWTATSTIPTTWSYYANMTLDWYHSGTDAVCSGSYINGVGALTPDEYLISPHMKLGTNSQLNFWAAATDASYSADHFGVFVSTTGTNPSNFECVQEWTLTAKNNAKTGNLHSSRDGKSTTIGNWYYFTVDLSAYAGQNVYIAFRHFNSYDQYIMALDDILLSNCTRIYNYTINAAASPSYGGYVSGGGTFEQGSTCTLHANANNGYSFFSWTENGVLVSTDPTYSFYVTENRNLVANFVPASGNKCTLVFDLYDSYGDGWNNAKLNVSFNNGLPTQHITMFSGSSASYELEVNDGAVVTLTWTPGSWDSECSFIIHYEDGTMIYQGYNLSNSFSYLFEVNCGGTIYYDITASANPTNGGTITGIGSYAEGSTCNLHAIANSGYIFTNWTENGSVVSTNSNYTFTVTGDRTLVAHFIQQHTINVSASPTNGGTVTGGGTYNHGQSCTVQAFANSGYTFTNWTENGNVVSTNANYTFTVNSNRTLVANFTVLPPNTYNINVSANPSTGGSVNGGGSYQQGQSCTVTATANTGYTFLRWTENGTQVSNNANYTFTVTGNRTLVAQFQANTYTISVSAIPTNGGTVTGGGNFSYGQSCTLTATPADNYEFVNWTKNENGQQVSTNTIYTFTVTESATYEANFQIQSYTINATPSPSNGGTITGAGSYNSGSTCNLTAAPNDGYSFVNWLENGIPVSQNATYSFTVTGNRNLIAVFDPTTYYTITATAKPSNGGTVTGGGTYEQGSTCILSADANDGYSFVKWTKNGTQVSTNPNYNFTVTSDASFVAHFEQNVVNYIINVSAEPSNGGEVLGGGSYASGTTCTLDAFANDGFSFIEWTNNGTWVSSNSNYSFMVTGNASYVAHFEQNVVNYIINVSAEPSNGGTVLGGGTYAEGVTCILTALPNEGFIFEKWTKDGMTVFTNPVYDFTVTENASFKAHFTKSTNQYTISAIAIPANGGEVYGGGTYDQGATCTLTASANNGFSFVNWTDMAGTELSADSIYSFTVASNMICLANFKPSANTYNITASAEPLDGGTITGEGTYEAGATCTLIAIPNPTYSFVSWTENGIVVSTDEHLDPFVVDCDRNFVAVFHQGLFYTITASAGNNGTISPEGNVFVEPNEDKTFALIPNSGCQVSKVLVDGVDRGPIPSYTFRNVNEDHTIHVEFSGLGVEDNISLDLKVYPNPANDKINIQCQNMKQISILNLLGVQIGSKDVNDNHAVLSTDNLPQGIYILKVENNDGRIGYTRFILVK